MSRLVYHCLHQSSCASWLLDPMVFRCLFYNFHATSTLSTTTALGHTSALLDLEAALCPSFHSIGMPWSGYSIVWATSTSLRRSCSPRARNLGGILDRNVKPQRTGEQRIHLQPVAGRDLGNIRNPIVQIWAKKEQSCLQIAFLLHGQEFGMSMWSPS